MPGLFDSDDFNGRLFFPRQASTPPPPGARDLRIAVEAATLHLRWHGAATGRPVVLLFHGNGEVVCDYDALADQFEQIGASLGVVDYRGYGESTGTPSLRTALIDAGVVLEAFQRETKQQPLWVMGRSLGSACAIELYGRSPAGVAGFIIDSGWSSVEGLARRRGLVLRADEPDRLTFDPLPKLSAGRLPLLVLHGAHDAVISSAEGRALFTAAGTEQKAIAVFEGFGHNDLFGCEEYWMHLERLLRG